MTLRLAAVNFFLALVGITQISRITMHEMNKKDTVKDVVEANVKA